MRIIKTLNYWYIRIMILSDNRYATTLSVDAMIRFLRYADIKIFEIPVRSNINICNYQYMKVSKRLDGGLLINWHAEIEMIFRYNKILERSRIIFSEREVSKYRCICILTIYSDANLNTDVLRLILDTHIGRYKYNWSTDSFRINQASPAVYLTITTTTTIYYYYYYYYYYH